MPDAKIRPEVYLPDPEVKTTHDDWYAHAWETEFGEVIFGDNTKLPTEEATITEVEDQQLTTKTDSVKTTEKSALDYLSMRSDSTKTVEKTVVDVTSSPTDSVKTTETQACDDKSAPNDPVKTTGKIADVNPAQSNPANVADDPIIFNGDKTSSDNGTTYNLDVGDNIYSAHPPPIDSPPLTQASTCGRWIQPKERWQIQPTPFVASPFLFH